MNGMSRGVHQVRQDAERAASQGWLLAKLSTAHVLKLPVAASMRITR
jgi:hypothetical protein